LIYEKFRYLTIPNFIYFKTPLFAMVFRILGMLNAPIPHQWERKGFQKTTGPEMLNQVE